MGKLRTILIAATYVVGLTIIPTYPAYATCGPSVDDRSYGYHLHKNIVHKASENWAMRAYTSCPGVPSSYEFKLLFYQNGRLAFMRYQYDSYGYPILKIKHVLSGTTGTGNTLTFEQGGNVLVKDCNGKILWQSHTAHSNGTTHYMHIRVDARYGAAYIYYGGTPGTWPWSNFI